MLVVALLAATLPGAAGQSAELRAAEGEWIGQISFVGSGIPFSGGFEFASAAGSLDGTFSWSGANTVLSGTIAGPDTMPDFVMDTVISGGVSIPDVVGGGEVQLTRATCERLEGVGVNIETTAPVSDTVWWAIRTGATEDPEDFFVALEALQLEVNLLIDDVEASRVVIVDVYADLEASITIAEGLAAQLDRTVGCGLEFYRSVIAAEVERLLDFVLANPDVDVFAFAQVILASVRSSVVSSGAEPFATDTVTRAGCRFRSHRHRDRRGGHRRADHPGNPFRAARLGRRGGAGQRGVGGAGRMRSRLRVVVPVVTFALLVSGCGADDDNGADPTSTTVVDDSPGAEPDPAVPDTTSTAEPEPSTEPADDLRSALAARGVESLRLLPTTEEGSHPILSWEPVEGAVTYWLVVLDADARPYWAWTGAETSVRVGGGGSADENQTAAVHEAMTWTVSGFTGEGELLAISDVADLSP